MEGKSKELGEKTNVKVAAEQKTADANNDTIEEMKPEPATSDPKIMEQFRMSVRISCFNSHLELIIIGISVRIVKDSNELPEVKKAIKSVFNKYSNNQRPINNCERKKESQKNQKSLKSQKGLKPEWYESILDNYHCLDGSSIPEENLHIILKTIDEIILARENENKYQQDNYIKKTFKNKNIKLNKDEQKGLENCPDKQESPFLDIVAEQIRKLNSSSLNIEDAERRSLSIRWKVAVVSEIIASFNPSPQPLLKTFCELVSQNDKTKFTQYLTCVERLRQSRNASAHKKPNGSEEHHMRFIKDARKLFDLLLSIIEPKDDPVYSELFPELKKQMEKMDRMLEISKTSEISQAELSLEEPTDLPKSMTTKPQQENNEDNQPADTVVVFPRNDEEGGDQQATGLDDNVSKISVNLLDSFGELEKMRKKCEKLEKENIELKKRNSELTKDIEDANQRLIASEQKLADRDKHVTNLSQVEQLQADQLPKRQ